MPFTHSIATGVTGQGVNRNFAKVYTADATDRREITVPDSTTDLEVAVEIDVSEIKSIYLHSTQNITLETNSGGAPVDTINLIANVPYSFTTDSYFTNLLATDVTAFFLTNSSGSSATFIMELIIDSTV